MDINYYYLAISILLSAFLCKKYFISTYQGIRGMSKDFDKSTDYISPKLAGNDKVGEAQKDLLFIFIILLPLIPTFVLAAAIYFLIWGLEIVVENGI